MPDLCVCFCFVSFSYTASCGSHLSQFNLLKSDIRDPDLPGDTGMWVPQRGKPHWQIEARLCSMIFRQLCLQCVAQDLCSALAPRPVTSCTARCHPGFIFVSSSSKPGFTPVKQAQQEGKNSSGPQAWFLGRDRGIKHVPRLAESGQPAPLSASVTVGPGSVTGFPRKPPQTALVPLMARLQSNQVSIAYAEGCLAHRSADPTLTVKPFSAAELIQEVKLARAISGRLSDRRDL